MWLRGGEAMAHRGLDRRRRMGYAEDARVSRFEGLGTARREKLEKAMARPNARFS